MWRNAPKHSQLLSIRQFFLCRNAYIRNSYQHHPDLARCRPMHLNDSCFNSSSAEAGVLVATTGHSPTPSCMRHALSPAEDKPNPLLNPQGNQDPTYLSSGFSATYSWCSPEGYFCL
ncbi:hypothetical protein AVEN_18891-1 [Araneus ventricosus]|uniref:Uncharacterized protein n=1 Tax=Araneus ventricosus TaxID=182803 RepID=A0A4Y2SXV4_ARAVE|nr:hypothetical protein AVEN_18891-1 [Araneus ventricosus]